MPSIPVPSSTRPNTIRQQSMRDTVQSNSDRVEVLEKSGRTPDTSGLIVQDVDNGDTTHAPSGDAVFDYVEGKRLTNTASLNFPNVVAFTKQDLTIAVTGATIGDSVALAAPNNINAGFLWCGWVSAADTVTVRVYNLTGVDINPAAQTWRATVFK